MANQNYDESEIDIQDPRHGKSEEEKTDLAEREIVPEQEGGVVSTEYSDSWVTSTGIYNEDDNENDGKSKAAYYQIPYGFQSRGCYKHASKNCEMGGVTYNSRFRQFVILDSRGVTSWSHESVYSTVTRHLNYPAYQFNVLRLIIFSWKYNVYFALSKEYALKVFNINFHEVMSVSAKMHSVLCMVFNPVRSELITGGTGGMKFWRFGEVSTNRRAWERDSRPMANYGLALRASYPEMGGSWVKRVELDTGMQRLYCLSERNVVAYDMMGNQLFEIRDAHRGPVTGCVYSKSCNMLVTAGNDCDVNVWSRIGGKVHTFSSHTKVISKIMLHPEAPGMVITASLDGMVKVFSLDVMEEVYSLPVFPEGIHWMECVSSKLFYCSSNRQIEVFALNHVFEFWTLSRCSMRSLSLVTCDGKLSRVMALGSDSSIRLISRQGKNLTTVLPPPPISPLTQVMDVTYNREFSMMYLLIEEQEIWVYYTRTNPATRLEVWQLDYIEDIHMVSSPEHSVKSRASTPWTGVGTAYNEPGRRSVSPWLGGSVPATPRGTSPWEGSYRDSARLPQHERLSLTCLGMIYSPVIMQSMEGDACPDATHFLMAGTKDGRVLFLSMFCKGMKYAQLQAHKDLIMSVEHDQITNTLVTKCRSLNGTDVQFWSLPRLVLIKQITCDEDITCSVRMGDLLLCGHKSGFLRLRSLASDGCDVYKDLADKGKRVPRDHHGPIISVDANFALEIFCSSSEDGFLKFWDKEKTLLREITLDDTLTAACFLNTRGDILVGLKHQIFLISHKKVYPSKDASVQGDGLTDDDEAFETESDIYEDPSVRYESKKILQPDPTNMENYLVPFPNLQLKASLFMEGRPPPDLEPQDQQDDVETVSIISDSVSLAPTDIYFSPSSTPRSLSLAGIPALQRKISQPDDQSTVQLWDLPDFGSSPVSSPPRTPPPEATPPPTPPPGSSEEEEEEENIQDEELVVAEEETSCAACQDPVKGSKDKKKRVSIPSFRREGGRLGNVRIDSKSLQRSRGPGYAAALARESYGRPDAKPRGVPGVIAKKTKKGQGSKDGTDQSTGVAGRAGSRARTAGSDMKDRLRRDVQNANARRAAATAGKQPGGRDQEPGGREQEQADGKVASDAGAAVPGSTQNAGGSASSDHGPQDSGRGDSNKGITSQSEGGDVGAKKGQVWTRGHGEGDSNQLGAQGSMGEEAERDGTARAQEGQENRAGGDSSRDLDPGNTRVVYVDPETGDTIEAYYDEMPEGAEILHIDVGGDGGENYDDEDSDDYEDDNYDDELPVSPGTQSERRKKSLAFREPQYGRKTAKKKWGSTTQPKGPEFARNQRAMGYPDRRSVIPMGDPLLQGDLISGETPSNRDMSPLTIFALARSRKESSARRSRRKGLPQDDKYSMYTVSEGKEIRGWNVFIDSSEQGEEVVAGRPSSVHEDKPAQPRVSISPTIERSSKKTDMMAWCLQALKSRRQTLFPLKPSRPGSSIAISTASTPHHSKEGDQLIIDMTTHAQNRPRTADTIQTVGSKEDVAVYPYQAPADLDERTKQSRDQKARRDVRIKTAPAGRRPSRTSDVDPDDAYREMHVSIESMGTRDDEAGARCRPQSVGGRPVSSLDFPNVDVDDYSGNWQDIVLERARLLKQQRRERQKSAKERRETIDSEQKERRKKAGHADCSQDGNTKPEKTIQFIPARPVGPHPSPPTATDVIPRELREQELSAERPFRLRMQPRPAGGNLSRTARSLISLKAAEHDVADTAGVMPKPITAASIPAKCSRYVLLSEKPRTKKPRATALEQSLLLARFPNQPLPSMRRPNGIIRPRSTPNVRLEY